MDQWLQRCRKVLEEVSRDRRDHAKTEADSDNVKVVAIAVVISTGQDANAGRQHHAEHHYASAPQYERRDGGNHQ